MYPFRVPRYGDRVEAIPSTSPSYSQLCQQRDYMYAYECLDTIFTLGYGVAQENATFMNEDQNRRHNNKPTNNSMA
jgi:hypothetical protein